MRSWVRPPLHTPQSRSLEKTLDAWQRLAPFAAGACDGAARQQGRGARMSPLEAEARWLAFKQAYLEVLEEQGHCRGRAAERLAALEEASRLMRERRLER